MKQDVDLGPLWEQVRRLTDDVDQTFFIEPRDSCVQPIPNTSEEHLKRLEYLANKGQIRDDQ